MMRFFDCHCGESIRIRSYFGQYFPAFGLNTDQNNSEYGHFLRSASFNTFQKNFVVQV